MNYTTAIFLINDKARAILATYEKPRNDSDRPSKTLFKTLDPTIKAGDYIVVPTDTRHGMTVVQVSDIDVDVDFDSHVQVQWVIGKVDLADAEQIKAQEQNAIDAIKSAEKRRKRDELRASLIADSDALKALPIYSETPAVEHSK